MLFNIRGRISLAIAATMLLACFSNPAGASATDWNPPRPAGVITPDQPFLKLPFVQGLARNLKITQGWTVEATEASIIGAGEHNAIDFEGYAYGAPIVAAADGWAWYSYERYVTPVNYSDPITGRLITFIDEGAGLVVEVAHDARSTGVPGNPRWVSQYMHLSRVRPGIPYQTSVPDEVVEIQGQKYTNYYPQGIVRPTEDLVKVGKRVKQGEVIGWHGDTGIGANWHDNWNAVLKTVIPRHRPSTPPWDPQGAYQSVPPALAAQLHFGLYAGRNSAGARQNKVDPFDLYAGSDLGILPGHTYGNPYMKENRPYAGPPDSKTAFIRDNHGNLVFAS